MGNRTNVVEKRPERVLSCFPQRHFAKRFFLKIVVKS